MREGFEWKTGGAEIADPTPQLGIGLGLRFINIKLKEMGLPKYTASWDDENKAFVIVGHKRGLAPLAAAIVFGDLELLQHGNPELLAETFECRVSNAINGIAVALNARPKNNPIAVTGASQGNQPQA